MKKKLLWVLLFVFILSFVGCGEKDKSARRITERDTVKDGKATERKGATGADGAYMTTDGEKIIIQNEDGTKMVSDGDLLIIENDDGERTSIGGKEWPKTDIMKNIPLLKEGKIVNVIESKDYVMISIEEISEKDFSQYINTVKKSFTKEVFELNTDDAISFAGGNDKGFSTQLIHSRTDNTATITIVKQ